MSQTRRIAGAGEMSCRSRGYSWHRLFRRWLSFRRRDWRRSENYLCHNYMWVPRCSHLGHSPHLAAEWRILFYSRHSECDGSFSFHAGHEPTGIDTTTGRVGSIPDRPPSHAGHFQLAQAVRMFCQAVAQWTTSRFTWNFSGFGGPLWLLPQENHWGW